MGTSHETLIDNKGNVLFGTKPYCTKVSEGREHSGPEQLEMFPAEGKNTAGIQGSSVSTLTNSLYPVRVNLLPLPLSLREFPRRI